MVRQCFWKSELPDHFHVHPHHCTLTIVFSNGPTILERGLAFLVLADEVYMAF
jgi:hypothetical protein